ncbi:MULTISPECIES: ATP-binding protein [unclassified Virgibacillus]|uniref:ATP-binding protein n=1 Tax=unclassified Virgibacillus TaxID=2620237 RepID=UPI0024DEB6E3|nr:ATP-binding protein [Virgibacillus sp. LDC-1]
MVNNSNKYDKNGEYLANPAIMETTHDNSPIKSLASLPSFMLNWIEQKSNDVVSLWDLEGNLLYISNSIEHALGYKLSELKGVQWLDFVAPEDITYIKNNLDQTVDKENIFNIQVKNYDERYIWCECKIAKLLDNNNEAGYFISIIRDITDKKEAEEMMIRSEKMSIAGQLAAGIAHEIRNPLTSLKGFLQLLEAGVKRKDVYYKIMIDEIEKMETITSELLFISKPLTDYKQQESVEQMIEDVIELLKPQAKLKNIMIIFDKEEDCSVYCDRSQIKQVLINIVKNAIEAMEESGKINVIMRRNGSYLQIDVIDEGPGIDEKIIHKLGEPFFTTKKTGTGLGLMITKQILERHDATLNIMQNEDKGSTFRITFTELQGI